MTHHQHHGEIAAQAQHRRFTQIGSALIECLGNACDDPGLILEHEPLQHLATDGELMLYEHHGFWQPMDTYREWKLLGELWETGAAPWRR